jgi:hypothetical protein
MTASASLSSRLFRDGFHALAVLPSGHLVAAVAGAIVALGPDERNFRVTHKITRGTRPLHITPTPQGKLFWGEYFDNPEREEVHVYCSLDQGDTWQIAYTFPARAIRHVHNIVFDPWADCLWIFTGDNGQECRILRASVDFENVEEVLSGSQQARAVAAVPAVNGIYFSSDTPFEANHVYLLNRKNQFSTIAGLSSSSIYGCRVADGIFFSTMVEPSEVNRDTQVRVYGGRMGSALAPLLAWQKDGWPMRFFQYGNAFLPDGENTNGLLAVSTIAVRDGDMETTLWQITAD